MLKKTINLLLTENQQKIIFRLWKISSHHIYIGVFASLCLMVSSGISIFFPISIGKVTNIFTDNEEFLKLVERLKSFFVFFPYIFNSIFTHANINRYIYKIIYKGAQRNILQISNAERH